MLAGNEEGALQTRQSQRLRCSRCGWRQGFMARERGTRDTTARTAVGGERVLNRNLKKTCYLGVKKHSDVRHAVSRCCPSSKAMLGAPSRLRSLRRGRPCEIPHRCCGCEGFGGGWQICRVVGGNRLTCEISDAGCGQSIPASPVHLLPSTVHLILNDGLRFSYILHQCCAVWSALERFFIFC